MKAAIIIVMLTTLGGLLSQCTKETTQKTPTTLNIDTTTISFGAIEKIGEVKIQNLIISKTGDEIVTWHATTDKSWLQLNQSSGEIYSKNDTIKLSLNSTALGFGDYTGEITITSSINNAMQTPVKIKVKVSITSRIIEGYVLNQNEVWSGNILLRGDIKIPSGYTLTINPGTKIMIAAGGLLFDGGFNTNKVDIYVFGNLIMNGTSGKPIQIMSSEDNATNEDWWGIGLTGSSRVEMTYCSMSNCSYGLFIFSDVSTAPVVNHCLFTNLQSSIVDFSNVTYTFDYNSFINVLSGFNFWGDNKHVQINYSEFKSNNLTDINIGGMQNDTSKDAVIDINNSNFTNNQWYNIYWSGNGYVKNSAIKATNCYGVQKYPAIDNGNTVSITNPSVTPIQNAGCGFSVTNKSLLIRKLKSSGENAIQREFIKAREIDKNKK